MRQAVRHQKWARLSKVPDIDLTTFIIKKNSPDPEFKIENDHEIIVNGKLYDVVRKVENGGSVKYFCVHDKKEETLISKTRLFNSQAQQMPVQNTKRLIVEKIIKTGIIIEKTAFANEGNYFSFLNFGEVHYSGPGIQITLPPPQPIVNYQVIFPLAFI